MWPQIPDSLARRVDAVYEDVNRELVKYMCGDSLEKGSMEEPIDAYLHTYYEDIEELYRDNIYRLEI